MRVYDDAHRLVKTPRGTRASIAKSIRTLARLYLTVDKLVRNYLLSNSRTSVIAYTQMMDW
jgi:hypothetical protein